MNYRRLERDGAREPLGQESVASAKAHLAGGNSGAGSGSNVYDVEGSNR